MVSISVITVTLNAEKTLATCLDSVLGQRGVEVEAVVKDGGSSDGTLALLEGYRERLAVVISEPDKGLYAAMNRALELARGEVVGILNADDYYPHPEVLARVAALFADPQVEACYGDLCYVDREEGQRVVRYWRAGEYRPHHFYWGWMPPHPTFFVRRTLYQRYGAFSLELGSAADYELMLRLLLRHRVGVAYLPEVLVHMRSGGVSSASLANRLRANRMDRKAWALNGLRPYPWTLWCKPLRKVGQWFARPEG